MGLANGIYHFDARGPALELVRTGDWQAEAAEIFYTWPFIVDANIVVCIGAAFPRSQKKYGRGAIATSCSRRAMSRRITASPQRRWGWRRSAWAAFAMARSTG